jgi:hypothetical protein
MLKEESHFVLGQQAGLVKEVKQLELDGSVKKMEQLKHGNS